MSTKARYDVITKGRIRYTCFTTTKTRQEIIDALLERFDDLWLTFSVKETMDGISQIVYSNVKNKEIKIVKEKPVKINTKLGIKVRDRETGEIHRSIYSLANKLGVSQMSLQRHLEKDLVSFRYEIYKEKILGDETI
jgi:prephenate dehydratase